MGRRLSDQDIIEAVNRSNGLISIAAKALKCSRQAIYERAKRSPKIATAIEEASEMILDVGESRLFKAVLAGDRWAVEFLLSRKGKARGYATRTEMTGADGAPLITTDDLERRIARQVGKARASSDTE